ncbi:MAG: TIR domain-containing protein [Chloroflexi bacterium]|nr:TIR domain-containing protein [Chloroflexota bacterium]
MEKAIFVSHATRDDEHVTRLRDTLIEATGRHFWVDHHELTPPEDNWRGAIQDALKGCQAGLLILSRNSVQRPEIVAEWTYLLNIQRDLFIAKIDDVPVSDIDYRLHLVQWIDLSQGWDPGISALVAAIRGDAAPQDAPVVLMRPVTGRIDRKYLLIPIQGRDYGLDALRERLKTSPTVILGIGGIGKSRVAAEMVMTSPDIDGAIWHTCTDVSRPDDVLSLIRQHFGLNTGTPLDQAIKYFRQQRCLLVIDNAELVAEEQRQGYVAVIEACFDAGAQVLLTSREEWDELDIIETYRPRPPSETHATQIVRNMQHVFHSPHSLDKHAERIARAARYYPGLIEWAVKQTRRFPPERVISNLRRLKSKKMQPALDEMIHRSLRQMVRHEGAETRKALQRLIVFRGGFTYEAFRSMFDVLDSGSADHYLEVLMAWQFVEIVVTGDKTRYWVNSLVAEVLEPDETAITQHVAYFRSLVEAQHERDDYGPLVAEIANLEIAQQYDETFADWLKPIWPAINAARVL